MERERRAVEDAIGFLRTATVVLATVLVGWWLSLGTLFPLLVATILLDMAFGAVVAAGRGRLDKRIAFRGGMKKAMEVGVVALAEILERMLAVLGADLPVSLGPAVLQLSDIACAFYLWHEALSVLEHAVRAGLPVPGALRRALATIEPEEERKAL